MNNILTDLDDFLAPSLECIKMVPEVGKDKVTKPGGGISITNDMELDDDFKVEM
jgi:hypothetical protein